MKRLGIVAAALALVVIAIVAFSYHRTHGPDFRAADNVLGIQNIYDGGNQK